MTREEAIEIIEKNLEVSRWRYSELFSEALEMAIKALEHEPRFILKSDGTIEQIKNYDVLDKIRAEIEQTAKDYQKFDDYRYVGGLWMALGIIDKYKAESENQ